FPRGGECLPAVGRGDRPHPQLRTSAPGIGAPARRRREGDGREPHGGHAASGEAHALSGHLRQPRHASRPARHDRRPHPGVHRRLPRQARGEGRPALGVDLGGDEHDRLRPDRRDPAAAGARPAPDQDHRAGRQPGDGLCQVPEHDRRAPRRGRCMSSRFGRRARLNKEAQEMNITAFMNLMVVLTPFLLITAVFSRMSIIELNLPSGGPPPQAASQTFELEVVVHKDRIDVADRNSGLLAAYPRTDGEYDYAALREKLKTIKAQFPELTAATFLLEQKTPYEIVVQTMDTVRTFPAQRGASMVQAELFPEISVGDAPP